MSRVTKSTPAPSVPKGDAATQRSETLNQTIRNPEAKPRERKTALRQLKSLANDYDSAAGTLKKLYQERKQGGFPSDMRRALGRSRSAKIAHANGGVAIGFTQRESLAKNLGTSPPTRKAFDQEVSKQRAREEKYHDPALDAVNKPNISFRSLRRNIRARLPSIPRRRRSTEEPQQAAPTTVKGFGAQFLSNTALSDDAKDAFVGTLTDAIEAKKNAGDSTDPSADIVFLGTEIITSQSLSVEAKREKITFLAECLTDSFASEEGKQAIDNLLAVFPDKDYPSEREIAGRAELVSAKEGPFMRAPEAYAATLYDEAQGIYQDVKAEDFEDVDPKKSELDQSHPLGQMVATSQTLTADLKTRLEKAGKEGNGHLKRELASQSALMEAALAQEDMHTAYAVYRSLTSKSTELRKLLPRAFESYDKLPFVGQDVMAQTTKSENPGRLPDAVSFAAELAYRLEIGGKKEENVSSVAEAFLAPQQENSH